MPHRCTPRYSIEGSRAVSADDIARGEELAKSRKYGVNGAAVADPWPDEELCDVAEFRDDGEHLDDQHDDHGGDHEDREHVWRDYFIDGATFILDTPTDIAALVGTGNDVLWAQGESLMIAGPMGLGKTTMAIQLMREQLGLGTGSFLGLPVAPRDGTILYLAMDRPRQLARAALRIFTEADRHVLAERVKIWQGPPPSDVAKNPFILSELAKAAGAATVYLDSVKDAAIGLSDDAVGAGYNRARQLLLSNGVELAELHHTVKRGANGTAPTTAADVYGSAWITAGTGSIVLLGGEPGDPVVEFRHVRTPANEIGPLRLLHDQDAGVITIDEKVDLVALATVQGPDGLSAKLAATVLFTTDSPNRAQVEKTRRKLNRLVEKKLLLRRDGRTGGGAARDTSSWVAVAR